jgi:hypothetical protein
MVGLKSADNNCGKICNRVTRSHHQLAFQRFSPSLTFHENDDLCDIITDDNSLFVRSFINYPNMQYMIDSNDIITLSHIKLLY